MRRRSLVESQSTALLVAGSVIITGSLIALIGAQHVRSTPSSGPSASAKPSGAATPTSVAPSPTVRESTSPVSNDEHTVISFGGTAGEPPDAAVWNYETGGGGWGNGELETYTTSTKNAFLDGGGDLVIRALHETARGTDGITRNFTSARITTKGKVEIQPGSYVEASLKAPVGAGVWPAFWTIGADVDEVGWPRTGELDILEGDAPSPNVAQSAIHLPSAKNPSEDKPYNISTAGASVDLGESLSAGFHTYGVYFGADSVRFFIDGRQHLVVTSAHARSSGRLWPFDKPQYLILNVAIDRTGASYEAPFPQDLTVRSITIWPNGIPASRS